MTRPGQPPPFALHPALRPHVRSMHHYDLAGYPPGEHIGLPSPTLTLVVPLDPLLEISGPRIPRQSMSSCLAGLGDAPVTIHHDGVQRGLQLALTPLGIERLLGLPAAALANENITLDEVIGSRAAQDLLERLRTESTWPGRLNLLQAELLRLLARHDDTSAGPRAELDRAWKLLDSSGGSARIDHVAAEVGWSPRHLTKQFLSAVGAPPKTVARIVRFERSTALVRRGYDLADIAARCHFADQAHMTREWARMAGTSPGQWARRDVFANVQDAPTAMREYR